jgi:hypothetical protein
MSDYQYNEGSALRRLLDATRVYLHAERCDTSPLDELKAAIATAEHVLKLPPDIWLTPYDRHEELMARIREEGE